jgi:hypothetical protein
MCRKTKEVTCDIGFQCLQGFHFEGGQNFDLLKSLHSIQTHISGSHRQLSKIITPQSLVELGHMGNHRKAENVNYDVGIEGFLRCHIELYLEGQITQNAPFYPEQNLSSHQL